MEKHACKLCIHFSPISLNLAIRSPELKHQLGLPSTTGFWSALAGINRDLIPLFEPDVFPAVYQHHHPPHGTLSPT